MSLPIPPTKTTTASTATLVLSKAAALDVQVSQVITPPTVMQGDAFDQHYRELVRAHNDLVRAHALTLAKLNNIVVDPVTHVLTFPPI